MKKPLRIFLYFTIAFIFIAINSLKAQTLIQSFDDTTLFNSWQNGGSSATLTISNDHVQGTGALDWTYKIVSGESWGGSYIVQTLPDSPKTFLPDLSGAQGVSISYKVLQPATPSGNVEFKIKMWIHSTGGNLEEWDCSVPGILDDTSKSWKTVQVPFSSFSIPSWLTTYGGVIYPDSISEIELEVPIGGGVATTSGRFLLDDFKGYAPPDTGVHIVTNGGFEDSNTGNVDTTAVKGWVIQVAQGINPLPEFEIVSDTVEEGNRALKISVHGLGANQWDIQVVADSIHVIPGHSYNYSIWAKADNPGAQVNFTMGNYSYSEYGAIRPANLTTQWQQYTMKFTVNDNQTVIRAPIHLGYATDTGKVIYIDNLQITDASSSTNFYQGPPFAQGASKFLGNAGDNVAGNYFANYWNQFTPGNAGKWGSIAGSQDTTQWNWSELDNDYNYAVTNHLIFKDHNLIWGQQQPSWISGLDSATQYKYIETWIRMVGQRYPKIDMVDVVNEPLDGHNPPDGQNGRANYENALGGKGTTGYDWVINAFKLARKYLPNAKLLINDYGIINDNSATTAYIQIINLLKDRGLIDGIGVQGHRFSLETADTNVVKSNLTKLGATGLPVYVSELDLGNIGNTGTPDDNTQLQLYKKYFPILWNSPAVKGITLWGYMEGEMWQSTCFLVHTDGTPRPALVWLAQYVADNPLTGVNETASTLPSKYELDQNYPNPFNPTTNIRYSIVKSSKVILKIFDVLGREVQTLVNTEQAPGQYTVSFNAVNLASGIYFYRITAGNFTAIKKLMLLK